MRHFESLRARMAQRSYWALRYINGTVIHEREIDWSLAPTEGRQSLRLFCPNGQVAELGSSDATGRLFQLKVAVITMGGPSGTLAQVIGHVEQADGTCRYAAWEYGAKTLVTGTDNVYRMSYQNIGAISFGPMGLRL